MNGELYDEEAQRAVEAICEENKELRARVEKLRKFLVSIITTNTAGAIPEENLNKTSDDILCFKVALSYLSLQKIFSELKKFADTLERKNKDEQEDNN